MGRELPLELSCIFEKSSSPCLPTMRAKKKGMQCVKCRRHIYSCLSCVNWFRRQTLVKMLTHDNACNMVFSQFAVCRYSFAIGTSLWPRWLISRCCFGPVTQILLKWGANKLDRRWQQMPFWDPTNEDYYLIEYNILYCIILCGRISLIVVVIFSKQRALQQTEPV